MMMTVAFAETKCGPEWILGRAIQIAPTSSPDTEWPTWKAKIGECKDGEVNFSTEAYFDEKPTALDLMDAFSNMVHIDPWLEVPEKNRTFYVFESDWLQWQQSEMAKVASLQSVYALILFNKEDETPIYSPGNPMPGIEDEGIISLWEKSWQQIYPNGALFVQIEVRIGGAKVKFLQKLSDRAVPFAIYRDIPVYDNWSIGQEPFDIKKAFPEYNFGAGFAPVGEQTHWSSRVYIP